MRAFLIRALVTLLVPAILLGCTGSSQTPSAKTSDAKSGAKKIRIAVIPKGTSHEFWKSVHAGAASAAKELGGIEIVWQGPAQESNIEGQIEIMRQMILQKVDGICLAPNHAESLQEAVQEANDAKIPVVVFDSGLAPGVKTVSYVATDNEKGGELAAAALAKSLGEQGNVILMRYRAGSESTAMREEGFLKKIAEYPKIKVLSKDQYGEATTQSAMEKGQQLLLQYKDEVNGVFAVCEPNCNGMLRALEEAGMAGKVKFMAFDPSDQLLEGMKDGKVDGIVLQDPVHMGYMSVKTMFEHLSGKEVETRVSTGEHVATKANMESDAISKLLHPVQLE